MDAADEVAAQYSMGDALPTLVFFKDGKEVDRIVGVPTKADIAAKLDELIGG